MKTVKINAFIIPNASFEFKSEEMSGPETIVTRAKRLMNVDIKEGDQLVDMWFTPKEKTEAGDNLSCHYWCFQSLLGIEEQEDRDLLGYFPEYLPKRLFEGVVEGDTRTFDCPEYGAKIEVTFHQQGYRYARFGNFESVLSQV